jgi:hypothetical protein
MTAESTPIVAGALTAVIDLAAATQWIGVVLPAAVIPRSA